MLNKSENKSVLLIQQICNTIHLVNALNLLFWVQFRPIDLPSDYLIQKKKLVNKIFKKGYIIHLKYKCIL